MSLRFSSRTILLAALCSGSLSAPGCGGSHDEGHVLEDGKWNLLARGADVLQDQPGLLTPEGSGSEGEPWGRLGRMGWEKELRREQGQVAVRATGSTAFLLLPAAIARGREIELEAWVVAEGDFDGRGALEYTAEVSLNGIVLGSVSLTSSPTTTRVHAPAEAWHAGDNLLGIALATDSQPSRLSLSRVRYDTPRAIAHSRAKGKATLEPDTALGFLLEPLAAGHLLMGAKAHGPGQLTLALHVVDRSTGVLGRELESLTLALDSQDIERAIALPKASGELLRVLVGWQSAEGSDAALELTELKLVEEGTVPRPPVILISIDTLAAKNSSLYGYGRDTTPALEALAADGVVFERCLSNATWTLPSFLSLMTGLYPGAHRGDPSLLGRDRQVDLWEQWYLTDNRWTLAEALRARGYRTAGWVDTVWLRDRFNFPQGFEFFDSGASFVEKPDADGGLRFVAKGALAWLEEVQRGEPYFLFLHAFDAHGPYSPDREWHGIYRGALDESQQVPAGGVHNAFGAVPDYITEVEWPKDLPAQIPVARVRAAYDEGLRMTDAMLGDFLDELRARKLYDEALIIVTSDHGETMGDGAYRFGHGLVEEPVLHIPLVVKLPGNRRAGTRLAGAVSLVDLYPSILSTAGGAPESLVAGLHGVPLFERSSEELKAAPVPIFSETGLCRQYSIEAGDWRLVELWPGQESTPEFMLTHPLALALLDASLDTQHIARGIPPAKLLELRADASLTGWIQSANAQGLTPTQLSSLRADERFEDRIALLRRTLRGPYRMLGKPGDSHEPSLEFAADHPQEVVRLQGLLSDAITRRDEARAHGLAPTQSIELTPDQLEELSKIGYAEK